jgi:adenosyl cobinamide kinase/adenosyl cobinamide phosphate guanylyltransferase
MAEKWDGPVRFVATGEARDDEMAERIARHRAARPVGWETVETADVVPALVDDGAFVVVDCVTLLVSRLMERELSDAGVIAAIDELGAAAAARSAPTVIVSNEVGSGIVPDNALARRFRDLLGTGNRRLADVADRTLLIVAGRALPLEDLP